MICELCGKASDSGKKIRLEGSVVNACPGCSKLGEFVEDIYSKKKKEKQHFETPQFKKKTIKKKDDSLEAEYELIEGYGIAVKNAREKMGLTQEQLAKNINEPASIIHRIESERFEPRPSVVKKLQKKLGIKLQEKQVDGDEKEFKSENKELTLGDMVIVRQKKGGR